MLPLLRIVILMSQQCLEIELAAGEDRIDDQSVPVVPDVEHLQAGREVRVRERLPHGGEARPIRILRQQLPGQRLFLDVLRFASQQVHQACPADHVHECIY